MRIISGVARGRKLLSPNGYDTTRPTLDRVKESMFDIIQRKVPGAAVLDVFAGTGSLGLEAVSRGAKKCFLVDRDSDTFSYLKKNVENLKFTSICRTINMDSYRALEELGIKEEVFDVIFVDPPYKKNMIPPAVEIIERKNLLSADGIIVAKIDTSEKIYGGTDSIVLTEHRKYGKTTLCFYKYKED
ncbi:16S rRNA (guanine(966)-N(2))-methyltransferase RsmD [Clostridium luticellarii]|jgi:16S rRNA (guanine966-N2)-methyltransferase|uniref:Ribosomal RNA small subunit methyltransferase D n=1 Tax=Clostridium luticellarii TaxID=1691940 RepID=A0A2T0BRF0_9CLOT|nr:16S rRNA (guanine(966)-N(2))-methyltransferase RsmD [Clostridium luticellarii]MCI1943869.1 16S rRNA (guanine(966)-N(2))-methyltransferase RsmD [Clostridium luticellarii]MCI1967130.1 16S rRNA (guanine(966)-N(2))-methyltransferase RsmD [Clostridium luticellarii]MCI1994497.1 16S rRNA (guanine(966)-N(2))-methyltransferase RsmD [Clostridium luticellarii]MCI2038550.1 16S rRNA (guanine(966)-N(2))-methyltransferase RsmD [Clostridium luticellarii]PRR86425.1 Ribosomal RNA small subunit methyltransfer